MLQTLISDLGFAEGLRWHNGELWYSDFITHKVQSVDLDGKASLRAFVPATPSGLGFLPDGTPLVVSMLDRRVLRIEKDHVEVHADLQGHTKYLCNDMLVDAKGNAYVGSPGYDLWYEPLSTDGSLLLKVTPDGVVSVAADDIVGPNGTVLLPGGKTLVIAETHACRLTAFDITPNGDLINRRMFADLGDIHPDGVCADADGNIWVSGLFACKFLLVSEGGKILREVDTSGNNAICCALGGDDGRRLFCASSVTNDVSAMYMGTMRSVIQYVDVETPA